MTEVEPRGVAAPPAASSPGRPPWAVDLEARLPGLPDPASYRNLLIVRLSAIGDVIRTLPALRSLRRHLPRARISWLVEEKARGVLEGHPDLDEVIVFPRRELSRQLRSPLRLIRGLLRLLRFAGRLRAGRFDAVYDLHGISKSGLLAWLTRAPVRIGFPRGIGRESSHLFLTHPVPIPAGLVNRIERTFHILERTGVPARPELGFGIDPPEEARRPATAFLQGLGLRQDGRGGRPFAVLHPGTSRSQAYKRWPAERFAELAGRLAAERDLPVVLTWGPGEEEIARRVAGEAGASGRVNLAPPLELLSLAALLAASDLFVGGDTGPMHLAAAMGVPVVVIYGPTDPELNRPLAAGGYRRVHLGVDCSPCRKRECRDLRCMEGISVEEVLRAAEELLAGRGTVGESKQVQR